MNNRRKGRWRIYIYPFNFDVLNNNEKKPVKYIKRDEKRTQKKEQTTFSTFSRSIHIQIRIHRIFTAFYTKKIREKQIFFKSILISTICCCSISSLGSILLSESVFLIKPIQYSVYQQQQTKQRIFFSCLSTHFYLFIFVILAALRHSATLFCFV